MSTLTAISLSSSDKSKKKWYRSKKDLPTSSFCDAIQNLLVAAEYYETQLFALSKASDSIAAALEGLARCDPDLKPSSDIMSCAGIHFMLGINFRILNSIISTSLKQPLVNILHEHRLFTKESKATFDKEDKAQSNKILQMELNALQNRKKTRGLYEYQKNLQNLLEETNLLHQLRQKHYEKTSLTMGETLEKVLHQTAYVVRAEMDVFDRITMKGLEPLLHNIIAQGPYPFDCDQPSDNIFTTLPHVPIIDSPMGASVNTSPGCSLSEDHVDFLAIPPASSNSKREPSPLNASTSCSSSSSAVHSSNGEASQPHFFHGDHDHDPWSIPSAPALASDNLTRGRLRANSEVSTKQEKENNDIGNQAIHDKTFEQHLGNHNKSWEEASSFLKENPHLSNETGQIDIPHSRETSYLHNEKRGNSVSVPNGNLPVSIENHSKSLPPHLPKDSPTWDHIQVIKRNDDSGIIIEDIPDLCQTNG